jgi:hypothetical protein
MDGCLRRWRHAPGQPRRTCRCRSPQCHGSHVRNPRQRPTRRNRDLTEVRVRAGNAPRKCWGCRHFVPLACRDCRRQSAASGAQGSVERRGSSSRVLTVSSVSGNSRRSGPHVPPRRKERRAPGDSSAGGSATSARRRSASSNSTTSGCGTRSAGRCSTAKRALGHRHCRTSAAVRAGRLCGRRKRSSCAAGRR